jgi:hypothetical protein
VEITQKNAADISVRRFFLPAAFSLRIAFRQGIDEVQSVFTSFEKLLNEEPVAKLLGDFEWVAR